MQKIIAIIPARQGSKQIKNKNIKKLFGKPLIYYSIAIAKKCKLIDRVIVSSDSVKIIKIAKKFGAEAPFIRPKIFANDSAKDYGVFKHCLKWLKENENYKPDLILHLRPTYPMRSLKILNEFIKFSLNKKNKYDSIRSVCEPSQSPYKMWTINKKKYLNPLLEDSKREFYNMPRQSLKKVYWQTAYLDMIKYKTIVVKKSMTGKKILSYLLSSDHIFDIDDSFSFKLTEKYFNKRKN